MAAYCTVEQVLAVLNLETSDRDTIAAIGAEIVRATDTANQIMLFEFDGDTTVYYLDGPADTMLYLPAPGAQDVASVVEDGMVLDPYAYYLEPRLGRYLMRLDANGVPDYWTTSARGLAVTMTPNAHPPAVEQVVLVETVRAWNARQAGYPELVGIAGSSARVARSGFSDESIATLLRVASTYRIRDALVI